MLVPASMIAGGGVPLIGFGLPELLYWKLLAAAIAKFKFCEDDIAISVVDVVVANFTKFSAELFDFSIKLLLTD